LLSPFFHAGFSIYGKWSSLPCLINFWQSSSSVFARPLLLMLQEHVIIIIFCCPILSDFEGD
jgi:hypothetical protein